MEAVLEAKNLRKEYGSKGMAFTALDGIDFKSIQRGILG